MITLPRLVTAVALVQGAMFGSATAMADQPKRASAEWVCMAPNAATRDRYLMVVAVPVNRQAQMEGHGFVLHDCDNRPGALARYRQQICSFESKAPRPMQERLQQEKGISPATMCAFANEIPDQ